MSTQWWNWYISPHNLHRYRCARCFLTKRINTFHKRCLFYTRSWWNRPNFESWTFSVVPPSCLQEVGKATLLSWHLAQNVRHQLPAGQPTWMVVHVFHYLNYLRGNTWKYIFIQTVHSPGQGHVSLPERFFSPWKSIRIHRNTPQDGKIGAAWKW